MKNHTAYAIRIIQFTDWLDARPSSFVTTGEICKVFSCARRTAHHWLESYCAARNWKTKDILRSVAWQQDEILKLLREGNKTGEQLFSLSTSKNYASFCSTLVRLRKSGRVKKAGQVGRRFIYSISR